MMTRGEPVILLAEGEGWTWATLESACRYGWPARTFSSSTAADAARRSYGDVWGPRLMSIVQVWP